MDKVIYQRETKRGTNQVIIRQGRVIVIYRGGWLTDFPVRYADGQIAYDRPEAIPGYLKRQVHKAFKALTQKGD